LLLDVHPDGPDEPQELARDGGHGELLALPARDELPVLAVEPVLRLPGDLFHLFGDTVLPST
jgi:hypothetical protein